MEQLKTCKAKGKQCNKCGKTSHFGKVCRNNPNNTYKRPTTTPRRINWVEADDEQKTTDEQDEEQYVLGIDGGRSPPFMMKGRKKQEKTNCRFLEFGTNCRLGRIVAWDDLSLGTNCRLGRIVAWDELSVFGIWDEFSLGTNRRLERIVTLRSTFSLPRSLCFTLKFLK